MSEKPGRLTDAERERVQMHPCLTGRILARVGGLKAVPDAAVNHHERLNGSGYPNDLKGDEFSVRDRIIAAPESYCGSIEPRHAGMRSTRLPQPGNYEVKRPAAGWTPMRSKRCWRPRATGRRADPQAGGVDSTRSRGIASRRAGAI